MPLAADTNTIDPGQLLQAAVRDTIEAAAAQSIELHGATGLIPYRLLVPRVHLRLHWAARRTDKSSWLFGLITTGNETRDADVRLSLTLELDVDDESRPQIPATPILLGFEGVTPVRQGGFDWALTDGSQLAVRRNDRSEYVLSFTDGGSPYLLTTSESRSKALHVTRVLALMRALERCGSVEPKGEPLPERPRTRTLTVSPLRSLFDLAMGWILEADRSANAQGDRGEVVDPAREELDRMHYVVIAAGAKMLVQLDSNGQPRTEASDEDDWVQIDVLLEVDRSGARIFPRLPDVLTADSAYFERFFAPLQDAAFAKALRRVGDTRIVALDSDDAANEFVLSIDRSTALISRVRASVKGDQDVDLVRASGTVRGVGLTVLLTVAYSVSGYPDVDVRAAKPLQVLAYRSSTMSAWQGENIRDLDCLRWLHRMCRTVDLAADGFRGEGAA